MRIAPPFAFTTRIVCLWGICKARERYLRVKHDTCFMRRAGTLALPRRDPCGFVAVRRSTAVGSSAARSLMIPHKVSVVLMDALSGCSSRGCSLEVCIVLKGYKTCRRPLTWEYCSPSFPSGIPPPLGKSAVLLKCGILFSSFLIKFESRIEIIKRRTVLTKRRSRGEEGDSTRTEPVST